MDQNTIGTSEGFGFDNPNSPFMGGKLFHEPKELSYSDLGKIKTEPNQLPELPKNTISVADPFQTPATIDLRDYRKFLASDAAPKIGINPNLSVEDMERQYDAAQSYGEAAWNVAQKTWGKTKNSFLDMFVSDFTTHDTMINSMYDRLAEEKVFDDYHPNFDSRSQETKNSFLQWIPGFSGSADNYEQFLPNLGFTLGMVGGAIAQNALIAYVTKGEGLIESIPASITKGARLWNLLTEVNSINKAKNVYQGFTALNAADKVTKGVNLGLQGYTMWSAFQSEAALEGAQSGQNTRDRLVKEYTDRYGYAPFGEDLDKINQSANATAEHTYWGNAFILLPSNFIGFGKTLMPAGAKIISETLGDAFKGFTIAGRLGAVTAEAEEGFFKAWKTADKATRFKMATNLTGDILKSSRDVGREGLEESLQRWTSAVSEDYEVDKYNKKEDFFKSTKYATTDMLSREGLQEFLGGAVTGLLMGGAKKVSNATGLTNKVAPLLNMETKEAELARKANVRATTLDMMNKSSIDYMLKDDGLANFLRETLLSKDLVQYNEQNDLFNAANTRYLGIYNTVWNGLMSGKADFIANAYKEYGDATDLQQLATSLSKATGKEVNIDDINKDNLRQFTDSIVNKIEETKGNFKTVVDHFDKTGQEKVLLSNLRKSMDDYFGFSEELKKKYNIPVEETDLAPYMEAMEDADKEALGVYLYNLNQSKLDHAAYKEAVKVAAISYQSVIDGKKRTNKLVSVLGKNDAGLSYNESISLMSSKGINNLKQSVKTSLDLAQEGKDKTRLQKQLNILEEASELVKQKASPEKIAKAIHEYTKLSSFNYDNPEFEAELKMFENSSDYMQKLTDVVKLHQQNKINLDIYNYLHNATNFEQYAKYISSDLQNFFEQVYEWEMKMMQEPEIKIEEKTAEEAKAEAENKANPLTGEVNAEEAPKEEKEEVKEEGSKEVTNAEVTKAVKDIQDSKEDLKNYNIKIVKDADGKHHVEVENKNETLYGPISEQRRKDIEKEFASVINDLDAQEEEKKQKALRKEKIDNFIKKYEDILNGILNKEETITVEENQKINDEFIAELPDIFKNLSDEEKKYGVEKINKLNELFDKVAIEKVETELDEDLQEDTTYVPIEAAELTENDEDVLFKAFPYKTSLKTSSRDSEDVLNEKGDKVSEKLTDVPYDKFLRTIKGKIKDGFYKDQILSRDVDNNSASLRLVITQDTTELADLRNNTDIEPNGQVIILQTKENGEWKTAFVDNDGEVSTVKSANNNVVVFSFTDPKSSAFNVQKAIEILHEKTEIDVNDIKKMFDSEFKNNAEAREKLAQSKETLFIPVYYSDISNGILMNKNLRTTTFVEANPQEGFVKSMKDVELYIATSPKILGKTSDITTLGDKDVRNGSSHIKVGNQYIEINTKPISETTIKRLDELMNFDCRNEDPKQEQENIRNIKKYLSCFVYTKKGLRTFIYNEKTGKVELYVFDKENEKKGKTYSSISKYNENTNNKTLYLNISKVQLQTPFILEVKNKELVKKDSSLDTYKKFILQNSYVQGNFEIVDGSPRQVYVNTYINFEFPFAEPRPEVKQPQAQTTATPTQTQAQPTASDIEAKKADVERTPIIGETLTSDSNQNYKIRGFTDKGGIQWNNTKDGSKGVWSKEKFDQYIKEGRLKYDAELAALGTTDAKADAQTVKNRMQEIEKQLVSINVTTDASGKMEQTSEEVVSQIKSELDKIGLPYSDVVANDKGSTYFVVTKDGQQHEILKLIKTGNALVKPILTKAKWINHLIKTQPQDLYNFVNAELAALEGKKATPVSTDAKASDYDSLVDNRISIDWDSLVYDPTAPNNKRTTTGSSDIIDFSGRKIVVINVEGRNVPFYLSTGSGGKVDVTSGKWYPIFGISESGWLNKLSGKEINNYYGSNVLKGIAESLDRKIGDIRNDDSIPQVIKRGKHIDIINKDLNPTENQLSTTRTTVEKNIKDTVDFLNNTQLATQQSSVSTDTKTDIERRRQEDNTAPVSSQAVIEKVKENQKLVDRTKTTSKNYVIANENLDRVSTRLPNDFEGDSTKYENSRIAGNIVDDVFKRIIDGEQVNKHKQVDQKAFDKLKQRVEFIKSELEKKGERIVGTSVVLFDMENRVAGEADLITVTKEGKYRIYDIKSSKKDLTNFRIYDIPETYNGKLKLSYREKHTNQLSAYSTLLNRQYNVDVEGLYIIPFQVDYDDYGYITNVNPGKTIPIVYSNDVYKYLTLTDKEHNNAGFAADNNEIKRSDRLDLKKSQEEKEAEEILFNSVLQAVDNEELNELKRITGIAGISLMMKAANSESWGDFTIHGVNLYGSPKKGTGYHESFHVFSQMFLTLEQKEQLYKEVREKVPELKDALPLDVEEFLADDYQDFRLNGKSFLSEKSKKTKNIFEKMLDFLKFVFGGKMNIDRAYSDLKRGNFFFYKPSVNNAYWGKLNSAKGLEKLPISKTIRYSKHADCLIGQIMVNPLTDASGVENKGKIISLSYTIKDALDSPEISALINKELFASFQQLAETKPSIREDVNTIIKNWKDFIRFNSQYSKNSFKKLEELDAPQEDFEDNRATSEEVTNDEVYNKFANEDSSYSMGKDSIKQMMLLVPKCKWDNATKTYKIVRDRDGIMQPANTIVLWNSLASELNNELVPEKLFEKLSSLELMRKIPEAGYIYDKLFPKQAEYKDEIDVRNAFFQSFGKPYVPIYTAVRNYDNEWYQRQETKNNRDAVQKRASVNFQGYTATSKYYKNRIVGSVAGRNYITPQFTTYFNNLRLNTKADKVELLKFLGFNIPEFVLSEPGIKQEFENLAEPLRAIGMSLAARVSSENYGDNKIIDPIQQLKGEIKVWNPEARDFDTIPSEKNNIDSIIKFVSKYTTEDPTMSMRGASGNMKHGIQQFNRITRTNYWLSKTNSYEEILDSPRHFQNFTFFDVENYANARGSLFLEKMFGKKLNDDLTQHERRTYLKTKEPIEIAIESYDGYNETELNEFDNVERTIIKKDVYKLSRREKLLMDINTFLSTGRINMLQPASKRTYYSMRLTSYSETAPLPTSLYLSLEEVAETANPYNLVKFKDVWKNYLEAELFKVGSKKYADMKYKKGKDANGNEIEIGLDEFSYFDYFSKPLKDKLKKEAKEVTSNDYMSVIENNIGQITAEVNADFMRRKSELKDALALYNITDEQISNNLKTDNKSLENGLLDAFIMNHYIVAMEEMKLFQADPQYYKDFYKRSGQNVSTGAVANVTDELLNSLFKNEQKGNSLSAAVGKPKSKMDLSKSTFVTIKDLEVPMEFTKMNNLDVTGGKYKNVPKVIADAAYSLELIYKNLGYTKNADVTKLTNELLKKRVKNSDENIKKGEASHVYKDGKFMSTNVTDGGGICTLDFYKRFLYATNNWSDKQERLYKALVAKYKLDNNLYKNQQEKQMLKETFDTNMKKSKGTVFNILKIQVNAITIIDGVEVPILHKFSLAPLLPSEIKGKQLSLIHDQMLNEGIDYIPFESSSKAFTDEINRLLDFTDKNGNISAKVTDKAKISIDLSDSKEQILTADHYKKNKSLGVQMVQLAFTNMMVDGKPIDYKGTAEEFRSAKYEDLSPIGKAYRKYITSFEEIRKLNREALYKELGIEREGNKLVIKDARNIVKKLHDLAESRDANSNVIDYIAYDEDTLSFKNPLDFAGNIDEIKKMINGLLDKKLRKMKTHGSLAIQMSDYGQRELNHSFTNPTQEDLLKYGQNGLPFYYLKKDKNGNTIISKMGCKITMSGSYKNLYNLKHSDGKKIGNLDRLNEMLRSEKFRKENDEALTIIGYRIPTQGFNSMQSMTIYEFLPEYAGNKVILPAGVTTQSGTDYDIDKMSLFFKHISRDGKVIKKVSAEKEKEIINRIETLKNNLNVLDKSLDETKTTISKNEKELEEVRSVIYENRMSIKKLVENVEKNKDQINEMNDVIEEYADYVQQYLNAITENEEYSDKVSESYREIMTELSDLVLSIDPVNQLQNDFVDSIEEVLTNPMSFYHLVKPNTTDTLENIADFIGKKTGREVKNIKGSKITIYNSSLDKHDELQEAKEGLGVFAVANKLLQNLIISALNLGSISKYDTSEAQRHTYVANPLLTDNELEEKITDVGYKLSDIFSVKGIDAAEFIQDNISESINMTVDVEANPFARKLGLNKYNIKAAIYLIVKGVPPARVWYFLNQPALMEYYKELDLLGGDEYKTSDDAYANVLEKYFNLTFDSSKKLKAFLKEVNNGLLVNEKDGKVYPRTVFDAKKLADNLTKNNEQALLEIKNAAARDIYEAKRDRSEQLQILAYFATINKEAGMLNKLRSSSAFDSTKINSHAHTERFGAARLEILQYPIFKNVTDYYKHSIAEKYNSLAVIKAVNETMFPISTDPEVSNTFSKYIINELGEVDVNPLYPNKNTATELQKQRAEKIIMNDLMFALIQNFGLGSDITHFKNKEDGKIYKFGDSSKTYGLDSEGNEKDFNPKENELIILPNEKVFLLNKPGVFNVESLNADSTYLLKNIETGEEVKEKFENIAYPNKNKLADLALPLMQNKEVMIAEGITGINPELLYTRLRDLLADMSEEEREEFVNEYPIVNRLLLNASKSGRLFNMELYRMDANETSDKNSYIQDLERLINHPDANISLLFKQLVLLGFYQSGYNFSKLYMTDVLPNEMLLPLIKRTNLFVNKLMETGTQFGLILKELGKKIRLNQPELYYYEEEEEGINYDNRRGRNYSLDNRDIQAILDSANPVQQSKPISEAEVIKEAAQPSIESEIKELSLPDETEEGIIDNVSVNQNVADEGENQVDDTDQKPNKLDLYAEYLSLSIQKGTPEENRMSKEYFDARSEEEKNTILQILKQC
jgi:hypothetical protein